jgi:CHASE3 domain sensor protein
MPLSGLWQANCCFMAGLRFDMNDRHFNILRWTPVGISIALLILIAVVSVRTVSQLKNATYWRAHTFKVILEAQALEDKLFDAQSGVDHYVSTGTPHLLVEYRNNTNVEAQEFDELATLTRDNPEQQRRLRELSAAIKAVFDYDNRVMAIYGQKGPQAAEQADSGVQERQVLDPAIKDVENIEDGEKSLLAKRDATEQEDYHKAARLLIVASVFSAMLLILSNFLASREMARRRRAEARQLELIDKLQKSLADVKTLSGLIPICGWCKSVRSDSGYWQTVENFVQARTDANFTHSMCPACAEKWKGELVKAEEG